MDRQLQITAVVLHYNSVEDVRRCLEGLQRQSGVELRIVIVDNASLSQLRDTLLADLGQQAFKVVAPDYMPGPGAEASPHYCILNPVNTGYAAGNNLGIRLGLELGADAVLIVNPDVRIDDPDYVRTLAEAMLAAPRAVVAASRIRGIDAQEQNPLREAGFWEEVLWPLRYLRPATRHQSLVTPIVQWSPYRVPKVSGCCMLIEAQFLRRIGGLDEATFLYCEEPILAATVHADHSEILFVPQVEAIHAHRAAAKGSTGRRMLMFIRSRRYYLRQYSGYGRAELAVLSVSYAALGALNWARHWLAAGR